MYELVFVAISVVIAAYFFRKDRNPGNIPPGPDQSLILGNFKVRIHCILYPLT